MIAVLTMAIQGGSGGGLFLIECVGFGLECCEVLLAFCADESVDGG